MHLQIMTFDGPRSPELVEAAARAGRERIQPIIAADPELNTRLLGGFRAVAPDGGECVVTLARDAAAFALLHQRVMASELLPGEDPPSYPARRARRQLCRARDPGPDGGPPGRARAVTVNSLEGAWSVDASASRACFSVRDKLLTTAHGCLPVTGGRAVVGADGSVITAELELCCRARHRQPSSGQPSAHAGFPRRAGLPDSRPARPVTGRVGVDLGGSGRADRPWAPGTLDLTAELTRRPGRPPRSRTRPRSGSGSPDGWTAPRRSRHPPSSSVGSSTSTPI